MEAHCITILGLPESERLARRCVESGFGVGLEIEVFAGTDRYESSRVAAEHGVIAATGVGGLRDTQLGCLMSHFRLWQRCCKIGEPLLVLEHDTLFRAPPPRAVSGEVVNMLDSIWFDPTWRFHRDLKKRFRDESATDRPGSGLVPASYLCLPGTGAYAITPRGAERLVRAARAEPCGPVDLLVNKGVVEIADFLPFPCYGTHDSSTVAPGARWRGYSPRPQGADQ